MTSRKETGRINRIGTVSTVTLLLTALAMLLIGGCSGDPTGMTGAFVQQRDNNSSVPPGGGSDGTYIDPGTTINRSGGDDTTLNLPGQGGGGTAAAASHVPPITEPEPEYFVRNSMKGEDDLIAWLKDCYETLPDPRTNPAGVFQNESLQNWAYEIFDATNRVRREHGLKPLQYEVNLEAIAQAHARDMALRNYFAHDTPDGVLAWDRWRAVEPPYVLWASENAAKGQRTAQRVVDQWMASPGHRKNLLNPDIEWTGVGVYFDPTDRDMPIHVIAQYGKFRDDPTSHEWYRRGDVWQR